MQTLVKKRNKKTFSLLAGRSILINCKRISPLDCIRSKIGNQVPIRKIFNWIMETNWTWNKMSNLWWWNLKKDGKLVTMLDGSSQQFQVKQTMKDIYVSTWKSRKNKVWSLGTFMSAGLIRMVNLLAMSLKMRSSEIVNDLDANCWSMELN